MKMNLAPKIIEANLEIWYQNLHSLIYYISENANEKL